MEDKRNELKLDELEQVTGGVWRTVNTGVAGLDAAVRAEPRKSSRQIGHIANGTQIDTAGDNTEYDPESGRHFVQVNFNGKVGWIAASILGLPR